MDENGEIERRASYLGRRDGLGGTSAAAFFCDFCSVRDSNALSSNPITLAHQLLLITQESGLLFPATSSGKFSPQAHPLHRHNYMMNNYWSYRSSLRRLTTQLNYYIRKHLKQPLPSLHANHASRQSRPFGLTRRSTLFASAISIRPLRRVCTRVSAKALRLLELRLSANTSFTFLLHTTSHIHVCRPSETTGACPVCTSATTSTSSASRGSTRLDCAERGWRQ